MSRNGINVGVFEFNRVVENSVEGKMSRTNGELGGVSCRLIFVVGNRAIFDV